MVDKCMKTMKCLKKHNKVQGKKVVNMFGNTQFRRDKQMRAK